VREQAEMLADALTAKGIQVDIEWSMIDGVQYGRVSTDGYSGGDLSPPEICAYLHGLQDGMRRAVMFCLGTVSPD